MSYQLVCYEPGFEASGIQVEELPGLSVVAEDLSWKPSGLAVWLGITWHGQLVQVEAVLPLSIILFLELLLCTGLGLKLIICTRGL